MQIKWGCYEIQKFYLNFLFQVLLQKLLYSCPNLDKVYILIREKKDVNIQERLRSVLENPVGYNFLINFYIHIYLSHSTLLNLQTRISSEEFLYQILKKIAGTFVVKYTKFIM